ncbi:MAG: hypothetical protein EOO14_01990 [Chitinophagaceae bacterium]|nr:MAG: hypothetical protein EOO14_01990 [Chitinophagaceae bacterium]
MRKFFFLLFLLLTIASFAQNNLSGSHKGSVYTYVYKISVDEARKLYRTDLRKVSDSYLHTLVDSFRYEPPALPAGNYLFANASSNRMHFTLHAAGDVAYKIINNNRDLVVALHNKNGQLLSGAAVRVNNKSLSYDAATETYRRDKYKKGGLLQVEVNRAMYVFPLQKYTGRQVSFWQTLWQPVKSLFAKGNRRYTNFWYGTKHEQRFKGFLVTNKPRYKIGDTVRLKAFVADKSGNPYRNDLLLRLSNRHFDVDTILSLVKPYRAGAFEHSFVLNDSLDLDLDEDYLLTLEEKGSHQYNLDDYEGELDEEEYAAQRKVVMRGKFYHEEYELAAIRFTARSDKALHSRAEATALYLKATDENDLAVMDGRVQVTVISSGLKTFAESNGFLPDTLWQYEQALDALGETKIALPDSIFPKASFSYSVEAVFLNSNNERQTQTLQHTFQHKESRLLFDLQGDSLLIDHLVKGVSQPVQARLYSVTEKEDTLEKSGLRLPARIRVHPFATLYGVEADSLEATYKIPSSGLVSAQSFRTADSVFIRLVNPSRLPVWYTVFAGNKVVARGRGDSLLYSERTQTAKNYFLSLQYIFNDKVHNLDYTVPHHDKLLTVKFTQPAAVYPGQTATVALTVNDAAGHPVPGADVTAWSYTRKFPNAAAPALPYFGKLYPGRRRYATFSEGEDTDFSNSIKLAWEKWSRQMHLDTIEYYKFLHPQTVYVNTEPAPDSLTQLAPFVVSKGEVVPVHQLYIDNVPVFFSASQHLQRYSFAVSPGRHSLRLRTHNSTIWLDSFEVAKGVKTFVSIEADPANSRIRMQTAPPSLTGHEKQLWSRYMLLLQNNFGRKQAYINSGRQLFLMGQAAYTQPQWVGPLPLFHAELVVKNGFTQRFESEGGYHYFISPGLVKQKQLQPSASFPTYLPAAAPERDFRDQVLTEKELDSLWQVFLYNRSASEELFTNPYLGKEGNGALYIDLEKDSAGKEPFVRHAFLFRYDDPSFLRIYAGGRRNLGYTEPGRYRLFFLLPNDAYFIRDSIVVKAGGVNFYRIVPSGIRAKDSVSARISAIVHQRDGDGYDYHEGDFNSIRETFNGKYFNVSQLTGSISGSIRDEKGQPLAGISVVLKGSGLGAVTDRHGQYSLRVPARGTLVISGVGYTTEEIRLQEGANFNLALSTSKNNLNDVVVVGYSMSRKSQLTGSLSGISVVDGIAGKVPGIFIRGNTAVNGNAAPLLIVDGVPFSGKMEDLDPAGIAGMNVLQAEAAKVLYGARAVNGAVLITTKKAAEAGAKGIPGEAPQPQFALRRNFRDDAWWQPRLRTDGAGRVSFTVTYPDDITAWRTFAMAVTDNKQSGFAEDIVRSFKAISGSLSLPQFAIAGDTMHVLGKALNYTTDTVAAKRSFFVNSQLLQEEALRFRNAWIDTFSVAAATADSLTLKYTLEKEDGYFDGEERSLPVFRPGVLETSGLFAALRSDTSFVLPLLSDTGTVHVYAEESVLPSLEKEIESLRTYEYLCNEQLASKLKALLAQKRIDSFLNRPFRHEKQVRDIIGKLSQNKASSGLWGWWKSSEPALWISLHAMEALVQADAQGFRPGLNKAVLADYLVYNMESYTGTEKLSALRLLQLLGAKADYRRYTDSLQKGLPHMTLYEKLRLAQIKQAAGLDYTLDSLLAKQQQTMLGNVRWGEESYHLFDNSIQATVLMYQLLKGSGGQENLLEKVRGYFLEKRHSGSWRNTYESSLILETILPDVLVKDGQPQASTLTLSADTVQVVSRFPFATEVKTAKAITVRKQGGLPLYFTAYQQRWNEAAKKASGDFMVQSWFEKNGTSVSSLKAGEPVLLKIAVSVKADANYVMIEAPIPAGCSYKDKPQGYSNNEVHREYFKNKVSIFCSSLKKGEYTFAVSLQPRFTGSYTLNPARAEMMYFPVFFGREEKKRVQID